MERGWKPNVDISPNCQRCGCSNTKFCYYNNYSLTQPRYFCKGCRRYWTKGGSLRNVPVGGGCRKNRRAPSSRLSAAAVNAGVRSKSLDYGGDPVLGYSHGNFLAADHHQYHHHSTATATSSSSAMPDGSHIDLALVYANYLNQKPDSKSNTTIGSEIPESQSHRFDPSSLEFPSMSRDVNGAFGLSQALHPDFSYLCGLDTFRENHDGIEKFCESQDGKDHFDQLPPLPGQEIVAAHRQDMLWTSSSCNDHLMDGHDHDYGMQAKQLPLMGPEAQDQNVLIGSWSPFDLPISCEILSPQHEKNI